DHLEGKAQLVGADAGDAVLVHRGDEGEAGTVEGTGLVPVVPQRARDEAVGPAAVGGVQGRAPSARAGTTRSPMRRMAPAWSWWSFRATSSRPSRPRARSRSMWRSRSAGVPARDRFSTSFSMTSSGTPGTTP